MKSQTKTLAGFLPSRYRRLIKCRIEERRYRHGLYSLRVRTVVRGRMATISSCVSRSRTERSRLIDSVAEFLSEHAPDYGMVVFDGDMIECIGPQRSPSSVEKVEAESKAIKREVDGGARLPSGNTIYKALKARSDQIKREGKE